LQTSLGFISPARIGRLPDARTPGVSGLNAQELLEDEPEEEEEEDEKPETPPPPPLPVSPVRPVRPAHPEPGPHELTPADLRKQKKLKALLLKQQKQQVSIDLQ
jgi:hypothetical protein